MDRQRERVNNERREILHTLENWLEMPLLVLGFVWLALFIVESVWGEESWMTAAVNVIWIIFIIDFLLKFTLAPKKLEYLKGNWVTLIALALPALRILRIFRVLRILRAARFARGVRLVRALTSLNRGLKALGATFGRRGFGYVLTATVIVVFAGAAGMFAFEYEVQGSAIDSYGSAVWFTAMLIITMGSDYFPKTAEGRLLCFLIALYGFVVFGYLTATLASYFVDRDAKSKASAIADAGELRVVRAEVSALRDEIRILSEKLTV